MLDRLQESRAAERRLVADASHELRTPVTSLRTNIEVLITAGDRLGEDERNRLLRDVRAQTEELGSLVNDLIELARGDAPGLEREPVRLDRLVEEAVERAQRHAPQVRFELSSDELIVDGVPERLGRALNNLLDSAARHSPEGGTVEVTLDEAGVRVRDHGRGVDPADLPHLFDRFYRGAGARGEDGTGLGLAIVRQVAEQHGGSVEASNADGGGACFTLHLPVAAC
jgi:two-component system sensor histidine kinase MprB